MDLEKILNMSPDESETFLQNFIESEHYLHKTSTYLKNEILSKCPKPHKRHQTKHCQLFIYSFKVYVATTFALIFLFSISPMKGTTYLFDTNRFESDSQDCVLNEREDYENMKTESSILDFKFDDMHFASSDKSKISYFIEKVQQWFEKKTNHQN